MASRDRIALNTPQARTTLKGWSPESTIHVDLATRRVTGFIRFYDTAGQFVKSVDVSGRITQNRRDNLAADFISDIIAQFPELAGLVTVETVNDPNDPVVNP